MSHQPAQVLVTCRVIDAVRHLEGILIEIVELILVEAVEDELPRVVPYHPLGHQHASAEVLGVADPGRGCGGVGFPQQRGERTRVTGVQRSAPGQFQQSRSQVVQSYPGQRLASTGDTGAGCHQRDAVDFLGGGEVLAIEAVRSQQLTVIGGEDHQGSIELASCLHAVDEAAELLVDLGDGGVVASGGLASLSVAHVGEYSGRFPVDAGPALQVVVAAG